MRLAPHEFPVSDMKKIAEFLLILIVVFAIGELIAPFLVKGLHSAAAENNIRQRPARVPTLQELIHNEVMAGRMSLPRKKIEVPNGAAIWLMSLDERQNQMLYTYEIVGASPDVFDQNAVNEMRAEAAETFREKICRIPVASNLLRQGMTIAHVYRFRETGRTLTIFVWSQKDC